VWYLVVLGSITAVYLAVAAGSGMNFLICPQTLASLSRRVMVLTALGVAIALG
jgi:hypothetical protein